MAPIYGKRYALSDLETMTQFYWIDGSNIKSYIVFVVSHGTGDEQVFFGAQLTTSKALPADHEPSSEQEYRQAWLRARRLLTLLASPNSCAPTPPPLQHAGYAPGTAA